MKKVASTRENQNQHWVGDGFPVRTLFSYNDAPEDISPFLLLDYAGPATFPPSERIRGVGAHPHRGFETVTVVYDGEVEHRDSAGGGGRIGPGDVQWMTAASGLVHEEKHGREFAKRGGSFEMIQLWVNLPAKDKMSAPRYQDLRAAGIPRADLPDEAGFARVIAGEFLGAKGPAKTFTPVNLWDVRLNAGKAATLAVPAGHNAMVLVLSGRVTVGGTHELTHGQIAFLGKDGTAVGLAATEDSKVLFLGGAPIREPVFGHGPFVMNTRAEIVQAFEDFEAGKMGGIPA